MNQAPQEYAPKVKIADLRPHPRNPREGDVGAIYQSIEANGFYGAVIAQKGSGYILAGNHRYKAAIESGAKTLPVIWLDVDDEAALRVLLADNRTNDLANYNNAALSEILTELAQGPGLDGTGYDGDDLDELLADLGGEPTAPVIGAPDAQDERAEELRAEWGVEYGQLWVAGNHRILCGDSTNEADVSRLMQGEKADMVFTDPPYGIDYQGVKKRHDKITNDDSDPSGLVAAALRGLGIGVSGAVFICCDWRSLESMRKAMMGAGIAEKAVIVWDKVTAAQHLDKFYKQHEFILYAGPYGGEKTLFGDVWVHQRKAENVGHPTPKPVSLVAQAIGAFDLMMVADPFIGSGSTLCACEQLGRHGRGMEIEPKYVAVTLQRLKDMGLAPVLSDE